MAAHPLRWSRVVVLGLVSGLAQVAAGVTMYLAGVYFAPWSMWVSIVVLAACIAFGNAWYGRRVLAGQTTYGQAFRVGVVIGVATGLVYVTYNVISISFVYPHFLDDMVSAVFSQMSAGMNADQAAGLLARLRSEFTVPGIVVRNLVSLSVVGAILSALIAVAFRKRRPRAAQAIGGLLAVVLIAPPIAGQAMAAGRGAAGQPRPGPEEKMVSVGDYSLMTPRDVIEAAKHAAKPTKVQRAMVRFEGPGSSFIGSEVEAARRAAYPQNVPVTIITSGRPWLPEAVWKSWQRGHEAMAVAIRKAKLVVAEQSDHDVLSRQPDTSLLMACQAEAHRAGAQAMRG